MKRNSGDTRTTVATVANLIIPAGQHDGANDDAKPAGATDDDAAHNDDESTRTNDAAAAAAIDATAAKRWHPWCGCSQ